MNTKSSPIARILHQDDKYLAITRSPENYVRLLINDMGEKEKGSEEITVNRHELINLLNRI